MNAWSVFGRIGLDASEAKRGLAESERAAKTAATGMETAVKKATRNVERDLDRMGRKMQEVGTKWSTRITAPIALLSGVILKVAGDFESSMNRVQALTQATGDDFERLSGLARDLGASTAFSASQAADAMGFLAQAGFTVDEIYDALPGTLQLAAAGQLELAEAADIASNVLTGFGLAAGEIGRVNDVMAATSAAANTNIRQLGEAFSYAGPVASALGITIEEAGAAMGLLSNAGIQASSAGTGLRQILTTLILKADETGVATRDAAGNMRPLADMLEDLEANGYDAEEAMATFGQRGGPALLALLGQGSEALRSFTGDLEEAGGTAQRLADAQMQGLNGAILGLRSATEALGLAIAASGLLEWFTGMIQRLTELIRQMAEADPALLRIGVAIAAVAAAIGPVLIGLGGLLRLLPLATSAVGALRTALLFFTGPVGLGVAIATIFGVGMVKAIEATTKSTNTQREAIDLLRDEYETYRGDLESTSEAERTAARERLLTLRGEMLERLRIIEETARNEAGAVEGFLNSPLGRALMPGFIEVSPAARRGTLEELAEMRAMINGINVDLFEVSETTGVVFGPSLEGAADGAADLTSEVDETSNALTDLSDAAVEAAEGTEATAEETRAAAIAAAQATEAQRTHTATLDALRAASAEAAAAQRELRAAEEAVGAETMRHGQSLEELNRLGRAAVDTNRRRQEALDRVAAAEAARAKAAKAARQAEVRAEAAQRNHVATLDALRQMGAAATTEQRALAEAEDLAAAAADARRLESYQLSLEALARAGREAALEQLALAEAIEAAQAAADGRSVNSYQMTLEALRLRGTDEAAAQRAAAEAARAAAAARDQRNLNAYGIGVDALRQRGTGAAGDQRAAAEAAAAAAAARDQRGLNSYGTGLDALRQQGATESQAQRNAPSFLERAAATAGQALESFGTALAERVPVIGDVIDAISGATSPMDALVGVIMALLDNSEAFRDLMARIGELLVPIVDRILEPLIGALTTLIDALWPLIEVALALVEVALMPLVWIIETIVAPVFNFVARLIATIWNGIARALNAVLGWAGVNLSLIDLDGGDRPGDKPDPLTDYVNDNRDDLEPKPEPGPAPEQSFDTTPTAVQFAVATPLVEASQMMLEAAQTFNAGMANLLPSAGAGLDTLGPFTAAIEGITPQLERLLRQGVQIHVNTGAGPGGSRTAALRGL